MRLEVISEDEWQAVEMRVKKKRCWKRGLIVMGVVEVAMGLLVEVLVLQAFSYELRLLRFLRQQL